MSVDAAYAEVQRVTSREAMNSARRLDGARRGAEAAALPAPKRGDPAGH
jgi:hypothetical protein